jgi:tripartite-type tricarboxylate transporter receptor subunit TctC
MTIPRRRFLRLAVAAAVAPALAPVARAQTYPLRPVRWVVGFAAGAFNDIYARLMGQWLSERLGQQFVIENRPGASSNIATEAVVRSAPDGYTLLTVGPPAAINATLYEKLNFVFLRDIAPVASIVRIPHTVLVNPSVPARTIADLIAYAKANPGKVTMASPGNGTAPHLAGEMFKMMAGVDILTVTYRGSSPALTDLLAGQVQIMFESTASGEYIRSGKLRALAVTAASRSTTWPELPTVAEFLPGYEVTAWNGVGAPRNTPAEIIDKLNREINAALGDSNIKARLADLGSTAFPGSPADFGKFVAEETEKWARVIKFAGIKPL